MKAEWLSDARKIPDEVMNYLRPIAVRAVEEKQYSPELIADILGISRSSIYEWLRLYRAGGEAALETRTAPGAPPAYSVRRLPLIPRQSCHLFQTKAATDSGEKLPPYWG